MKQLHIIIKGHVQGVFFRTETKQKADELGVSGWVKNCDDGSVEIFSQGTEEALKILEEWCRKGPASAEVQNVRRKDCTSEKVQGFEIW